MKVFILFEYAGRETTVWDVFADPVEARAVKAAKERERALHPTDPMPVFDIMARDVIGAR